MRTLTLLTTVFLLFVSQTALFGQNSDTCRATYSTISPTSCGIYTSPGWEFYDSSGTYYDTIPNTAGCDSIITINLTVEEEAHRTINAEACESYTVPSGDTTYYTSGTYYDTVTTFTGCDSVFTINLTMTNTLTSAISPVVCQSYTVPSGDETYETSGTYYDTIPSAQGCDSVITINLTVGGPLQSTTKEFIFCETYTVPSGDESYETSGTYYDTLTSAGGCDSIIEIDLTAHNTTYEHKLDVTTCGSYTVPSGDTTYSISGTYLDTVPGSGACDTVYTINLTISNTLYSSIYETVSCGSYTVPSGDDTYETSGTYYDTLTTANGCDSIIEINLYINQLNASIITSGDSLTAINSGSNTSYQWLDCSNGYSPINGAAGRTFRPDSSGDYAVVVRDSGCVDTSDCRSFIVTGVVQNSFNQSLKAYPNPTQGQLTIELGQIYENIQVTVKTNTGRIVSGKNAQNTDELSLNIEEPAGYYIVTIRTDSGRHETIKVLKK